MDQVILDHCSLAPINHLHDLEYKPRVHLKLVVHQDYMEIVPKTKPRSENFNGLISLFGKYPNFILSNTGIVSNKSEYVKNINTYGMDFPQSIEYSIEIDKLLKGVLLLYDIDKNEPRFISIYGDNSLVRKSVLHLYDETIIKKYGIYGDLKTEQAFDLFGKEIFN